MVSYLGPWGILLEASLAGISAAGSPAAHSKRVKEIVYTRFCVQENHCPLWAINKMIDDKKVIAETRKSVIVLIAMMSVGTWLGLYDTITNDIDYPSVTMASLYAGCVSLPHITLYLLFVRYEYYNGRLSRVLAWYVGGMRIVRVELDHVTLSDRTRVERWRPNSWSVYSELRVTEDGKIMKIGLTVFNADKLIQAIEGRPGAIS